jgi:hypothetical protein
LKWLAENWQLLSFPFSQSITSTIGYILILALVVASLLAVGAGFYLVKVLKDPDLVLWVPLLLLLSGAGLGLFSLLLEVEDNWAILLGNLQLLPFFESFVRFILGFGAVLVAAVFSSWNILTMGLGIFAFSGPGLLLVYQGQELLRNYWSIQDWWIAGLLTLLIYLLLTLSWFVLLQKKAWLEEFKDELGFRMVGRLLERSDITTVELNQRLAKIDSWLDPAHDLEQLVEQGLRASSVVLTERKSALARLREVLIDEGRILPRSTRHQLELVAVEKPEIYLILAEQAFMLLQPVEGFIYLARVFYNLPPRFEWLEEQSRNVWESHLPEAQLSVLQSLWQRAQARRHESNLALTVLAMIALQKGLPLNMLASLGRW